MARAYYVPGTVFSARDSDPLGGLKNNSEAHVTAHTKLIFVEDRLRHQNFFFFQVPLQILLFFFI